MTTDSYVGPTQDEFEEEESEEEPYEFERYLTGSMAPTAGVAVVDLGTPAPGKEWEVKRYFVTGQDPTTALVGSGCVVFVSSSSDQMGPFEAIDTTATSPVTTVPNKGAWDARQVIVHSGRRLLFRFSGMGTSIAYVNAVVIERDAREE